MGSFIQVYELLRLVWSYLLIHHKHLYLEVFFCFTAYLTTIIYISKN
jgi:hypothetical protein